MLSMGMDFTFPSVEENIQVVLPAVLSYAAWAGAGEEDLSEIKSAISEALENAREFGYRNNVGLITVKVRVPAQGKIKITVKDSGVGIDDISRAQMPLFTTGGPGHAGLGFTVIDAFMDEVKVKSNPGKGTIVTMRKRLRGPKGEE